MNAIGKKKLIEVSEQFLKIRNIVHEEKVSSKENEENKSKTE
jgi:hypothetical protein